MGRYLLQGRDRGRIIGIYGGLAVANLAVWAGALLALGERPVLLGTALIAYGFGLRHAVDADHIAAIDNVTRKLMQEGKRPLCVGLFFALGHATVVILASSAIALAASAFKDELDALREIGGVISTAVSALFLLAVAVINMFVLRGVYRSFARVKAGGGYAEEDLDRLLQQGGLLARLLRPLFAMLSRSWQMYPLGFLFGLGFETASEVALLGISAEEAAKGLSVWAIMIFPALFTASMTLIDTTDGILMVGAYGWAYRKPIRKLYYNMTITAVSVLAALVVGGVEVLGLVGDRLSLSGGLWDVVAALNENFGGMGYLIIAIFVLSWIGSAVIYRLKGFHRIDAAAPSS
ncbi:MAG TPA: HoxN/HupN/NixA family nickel/cobalt transporter [Stellaceae bacterium]|nr:HoxN/HupN/NixA family nickel/cobalt transporter [Stellaceae bacterium]